MNNKNADVEYVANQILKQLQNDVAKEIRLGEVAEPDPLAHHCHLIITTTKIKRLHRIIPYLNQI